VGRVEVSTPRILLLDREESAWAAGFFEGEGSCSNRTNTAGRRITPVLSITQVVREPLDRFQRVLGGRGRVNGPYRNSGVRKPYFQFTSSNFEATQHAICLMCRNLSSRRRYQIRSAFAAWHAMPHRKSGPHKERQV
jgi:hypothetical protein